MRLWLIAVAILAGVPVICAADPALEERFGIGIGETAPDFKLLDQNGQERTLSGLLKDGAIALVFYRSASW